MPHIFSYWDRFVNIEIQNKSRVNMMIFFKNCCTQAMFVFYQVFCHCVIVIITHDNSVCNQNKFISLVEKIKIKKQDYLSCFDDYTLVILIVPVSLYSFSIES